MLHLILAFLIVGPPLTKPTLTLRIHCAKGIEGRVIHSEWEREHPYFRSKRWAIERHYRVVIDDDANCVSTYQIGHGERQPFKAGTFRCSGTFMRAVESVAACDHWDRTSPFFEYGWAEEPEIPEWRLPQYREHMAGRPEEWPRNKCSE